MTTTTGTDPQISMDESNITEDHLELAAAAKKWDDLEHAHTKARRAANQQRKGFLGQLETLELDLGKYRIGPVLVTVRETADRHVEYDIEPGQLKMSLKASKTTG